MRAAIGAIWILLLATAGVWGQESNEGPAVPPKTVNASAVALHPAVDVGACQWTGATLQTVKPQMESEIRNHRTRDDLLKPWTKEVSEWGGAWAVCLTPAARLTGTLYDGVKLHLADADISKLLDASVEDADKQLRFLVQLCSKGKGSWLWPYKAGPGSKASLDQARFVLGVGSSRNLQSSRVEEVESHEHSSKYWAGLIAGGTRTKIDYYATFAVDFPLRDDGGSPLITPADALLTLRIIGPSDEWTAQFKLSELPVSLLGRSREQRAAPGSRQ
jgi:hypothetical protein